MLSASHPLAHDLQRHGLTIGGPPPNRQSAPRHATERLFLGLVEKAPLLRASRSTSARMLPPYSVSPSAANEGEEEAQS